MEKIFFKTACVIFCGLSWILSGCGPTAETVFIPYTGGTSAADYLETIRLRGDTARAANPFAVIGGGGSEATDALTRDFVACGEAEEIDFWCVPDPTPGRIAAWRKCFDANGGKAVRLIGPDGTPLEKTPPVAKPVIRGVISNPLLITGTGRVYLMAPDGSIIWERKGCGNIHRAQMRDGYVYYSNGSLYRVKPPSLKAERVYCSSVRKGGGVLGFQILPDGSIVMAENATGSVVELDAETWREKVRFQVDVRGADGTEPGAHGRLRMIRKTAKGTYLVCCAGAAYVREYDKTGRLVWEQAVPVMAFDAERRANGNTLVSHITGITEYAPDHRVVWSVSTAAFPEMKEACWCGIQERPDGHLIVGTWSHGTPDAGRVTAFEITREKKIVWCYASAEDRTMMSVRMQ